MRVVPNLKTILKCPNCGSSELYEMKDPRYLSSKIFCLDCHEEIVEGNITIDNSMLSIPQTEGKAPNIETNHEEAARRAQEEKDKFLFNLREEIDRLRYNIHDTHSMMLVNKLTDIFTQIADYIENH